MWNFQLSDVTVDATYRVFLPATKNEQPETSAGIGEQKKTFVPATDTASFFVRDMKLTTADHRLFLSKDKILGLGRPPKRPRQDDK